MRTILKLDKDAPDKELEFELAFLRRLSRRQRFEMMWQRSKEIWELLKRSGHRRTSKITKRA